MHTHARPRPCPRRRFQAVQYLKAHFSRDLEVLESLSARGHLPREYYLAAANRTDYRY